MDLPWGELFSIGAALCWAVGLTLFRTDVRLLGARPVNLFKGIVATPLFLGTLAVAGSSGVGAVEAGYLVLSGIVGIALGDSLILGALKEMGPHKASLFGILGPALTAVGGWLFLAEALGPYQLVGIAAAISGIAMVVYFRAPDGGGGGTTRRGVVFGICSAFCQAAGVLLTKRGLEGVDALPSAALRLAAATAALALFGFARGSLATDLRGLLRRAPVGRLVPAACIGTFGGIWLMQAGIAHTESAVANALHSTTPLFTLPITLLVLRERVPVLAVAGSFVAVGGVVTLLLAGA